MAKGDLITPAGATRAMSKIREMQSKWGLTQRTKTYSSGNVILRTDASDLYSWLAEGKSKSGWTGTVPTSLNVTAGSNIIDVFDVAYSTAESIRTYCRCNCNYCSCDCDRCSCDSDYCCTDGNNSF